MSTLDDIRQTFFQECEELLESLDDGLEALRDGLDEGHCIDGEVVNEVFRSVHSIKGGAAAFGLEYLVRFAHQFETTLDDLRSLRLPLSFDVLEVCLRAADKLAELVLAGREGRTLSEQSGAQIVSKLLSLSQGANTDSAFNGAGEEDPNPYCPVPLDLNFSAAYDESLNAKSVFKINFRAQPKLFLNGHDPVHLFRELSEIGELEVKIELNSIPDLADVRYDYCQLIWNMTLCTDKLEAELWDIFDFVVDLCSLDIEEVSLLDGSSDRFESLCDISIDSESSLLAVELPRLPQSANIGIIEAAEASAVETVTKAVPNTAKATVRVELEQVDRLINVVGELVINQAVLTQCIVAADIPMTSALSSSLDEFMSLAREIQEGVMSIRAQSVKPLFQRMARIAREAADLAGKSVRFETEGEATEVDKTVIEKLVDPLTHIIRNAVDHGLETEVLRKATGKTEPATVTLRAAHRSGRVLIDVFDNGAGINRSRVLKVAKDKGLIPHDAVVSDAEIDKLLFLPGFSTAAEVTDLSGRGVGMDVVRSSIQKLGGRINITSEPGVGTVMSISLPLTLAVLDGMVVDVAGQTMVVPIATIVETIRPDSGDLHRLANGMTVVAVRGRFIPIVDLGHVFQFRDATKAYSDLVYLLVESDHHQMWALAVDRIHDQRQVVIKGLESNYGHVPGVAAATILGDGKVALIIDPEEAVQRTDADRPVPNHSQLKDG